jgi:hypothetical protein
VSVDAQLEVVLKQMWRYRWRPCSSELRDAPQDHDRVSLEMHSEAVIERDLECTCRL